METNVANHRSSVMFLNNNRNMVIEEDDGSSEIADNRQYLIKNGTKTTLSSGKDIAHLRAMNDRCQIVGYKNGKSAAALWQSGKWYNLSDLIPAQTGWDLEVAKDINERGQIIGVGKLYGKTRAFLLTPIS